MSSRSVPKASLLIAAFLVAAVGMAPGAQAVTFADCDIINLAGQNVGAPQRLLLIIDSDLDLAKNALAQSADLDGALSKLKAPAGPPQQAKINIVRNSGVAKGLQGVVTRSFLDAAEHTLNKGNNFAKPVQSITIGKLEAYYYDDSTQEGCLRVLMETTSWHTTGSAIRTIAYRWTISGSFNVAGRTPSGDPAFDPNDVFPDSDTVPIPVAMAEDENGEPFQYKLWAKGNMIQHIKVEKRKPNGTFQPVQPSDGLHQVTDQSCIDMMFKDYPPQTLSPDAAPPFYCLGRCEDPPIINTR